MYNMASDGEDDINVISEEDGKKDPMHLQDSCENETVLKRKNNSFDEREPTIPIRRKVDCKSDNPNLYSAEGSSQDKLLSCLKEHLILRRGGEDDDDDEEEEEEDDNFGSVGDVPPQNCMEPVIPPSECFGLDLTPTLQNVVSTVNMGCVLDLQKITFCTRMSEYNPARFSGVVMRIREPHTTALIFRSGKMVVTGAKTEGDAHLASRKYARIIQKLGFNVHFQDFKIQNIVGTFDVKFPIRVEDLNQVHGQFCRYEPELFPGLIYRLVKPRVVLLIFVNGKVVLTGARNRSDLKEALKIMYPVLKSFKKDKSL